MIEVTIVKCMKDIPFNEEIYQYVSDERNEQILKYKGIEDKIRLTNKKRFSKLHLYAEKLNDSMISVCYSGGCMDMNFYI